MAKPNKIMTSLRLSPEARSLIVQLAEQMQLTQVDVVEVAVRNLANKQKRAKKNASM